MCIERSRMFSSNCLFRCLVLCCLLVAILICIGNQVLHNEYACQQERKRSISLSLVSQTLRDVQDGQRIATIDLETQSDRKYVYVSINGFKIYEINEVNDRSRGLHVIILNHHTCALKVYKVFDVYGGDSINDFSRFINSENHVSRIAIFLIKDEASIAFRKVGRNAIRSFGCKLVDDIAFRDNWVCITRPRVGLVAESIVKRPNGSTWASPAKVRMPLKIDKSLNNGDQCNYTDSYEIYKRKSFCKKYNGYENACNFSVELFKEPPELITNNLAHAPVAIIASNRPRYLFRMLYRLLNVPGADRKMMTVFIDGVYNEAKAVAELLGLRVVINQIEIGCHSNCRVQQQYRKSLSKVFNDFPFADVAIIIEEDLEVADDFFDYFSQTYPLLESDPSIYCISAWNDQGYQHSVKDPSLLYRVEFMPGLGWMLTRSLYKDELEPNWPSNRSFLAWDLYMRQNSIRKDRECIIPDISRTYHFGAIGMNINKDKQKKLFELRALNREPPQKLHIEDVKKNNYEKVLERLISNGEVLNHTKTSCKNADDIIPNTKGKVYVIFIKMEKNDYFNTWLRLAKCFKLWDDDFRDFHYGLIRFWIKENHIIVIGSPESRYAHYKPKNIIPVEIKERRSSNPF